MRLIYLLALLISSFAFAEPIKVPIVFVLYDAGETFALKPVMQELKNANVKYKALVMGTARSLMKDQGDVLDIQKDCGVSVAVDQKTWPREQALSDEDLRKVSACFEAQTLVTGMVSKIQNQIASAATHSKVFAYYDGLAPLGPSAKAIVPAAYEVLVPDRELKEEVLALKPDIQVEVVGQPTLDEWANYKRISKPHPKTLLYAGGYGDGYAEAFELFVEAAKRMPKVRILVSIHPKADGSLEAEKLKGLKNVSILPKSISTIEAASMSDVVATRTSTVGVQACFMGKPVVLLDLPNSKYTDFALAHGFSKRASDPADFVKKVSQSHAQTADIFEQAGIPRDSAKRIATILKER